jgi:hypothetical protein
MHLPRLYSYPVQLRQIFELIENCGDKFKDRKLSFDVKFSKRFCDKLNFLAECGFRFKEIKLGNYCMTYYCPSPQMAPALGETESIVLGNNRIMLQIISEA